MKKTNKVMRLAAVLLVLTLISSCFVGGTFAKYVSEGKGEDSARVAKWGVTAEWSGDIFSSVYDIGEDSFTVQSGGGYVVAPGTESPEPYKLTFSGTPEVACEYTIDFNIDLEGWNIKPNGEPLEDGETPESVETEFYCPLIFTFNGATQGTIDGSKYGTQAELIAEIERVLTEELTLSGKFEPNQELDKYFVLKWEWPFEGEDTKDTYLGDKAARGAAPTISIDASATVTQID